MKKIISKFKEELVVARNVVEVFSEGTPHPLLKVWFLVFLGILTVLFESISISMLIPILQKVVGGVKGGITIPVQALKPFQDWINQWQGYRQFIMIGLFLSICGLVSAVLTVIKRMTEESISLKLSNHWKEKLFRNIIFADITKVFQYKIGYLQNLIVVECGNIRFLYRGALQLITAVVMGGVYIFFLSMISARLTCIVLILLVVTLIPVYKLIKFIRHTSFSRAQSRAFLGSIIVEVLNSIKIIHLFKTFDFETLRFKQSIDNVYEKEWQMLKCNSLIGPLNRVIGIILPLVVIFIGLYLHKDADAKPLWILLFVIVFVRLAPISQSISTAFSTISKVYGSVLLIKSSLSKFSKYEQKNGSIKLKNPPHKIIFDKVNFEYEQGTPVLKDVSFEINAGQHVAFIGPSGSGKSTVVGLIIRLFTPSSGNIFLDADNLKDYDIYSWRDLVGLVDQSTALFNESIKFNIAYGVDNISMEDVVKSAKMANADEFINKLSAGYETRVGSLGYSVSGGQRQRIAIARALSRNPQVIVLDEATSSIDLESEKLIAGTISRLKNEGKTIINISHRLSSVRDADILYFIEDGQIKAKGSFKQLLAESETFRNYLKLQNVQV